MMKFQKATKSQSRLRLALFGPSGSGKTYTALSIASAFGKVAVIDTERGSASKYADQFEFDVIELNDYAPEKYIEAIHEAAMSGYDVLVIDSLSHAWNAKGGILEMVDKAAKRDNKGNSFTAWRDVTPQHNALVEAITGSSIHIIATMRSKTEYVMETNDRGKVQPRKVGLAPVQRDGMEYEFDVCGEMNTENELIISKSRCFVLNGAVVTKPNIDVGRTLKGWLTDGVVKAWSDEEIVQFVARWRKENVLDEDMKTALKVKGLREFKGTVKDADKAMRVWLNWEVDDPHQTGAQPTTND